MNALNNHLVFVAVIILAFIIVLGCTIRLYYLWRSSRTKKEKKVILMACFAIAILLAVATAIALFSNDYEMRRLSSNVVYPFLYLVITACANIYLIHTRKQKKPNQTPSPNGLQP